LPGRPGQRACVGGRRCFADYAVTKTFAGPPVSFARAPRSRDTGRSASPGPNPNPNPRDRQSPTRTSWFVGYTPFTVRSPAPSTDLDWIGGVRRLNLYVSQQVPRSTERCASARAAPNERTGTASRGASARPAWLAFSMGLEAILRISTISRCGFATTPSIV
jgi:hypothetical protein